jgi:hypothetical protein
MKAMIVAVITVMMIMMHATRIGLIAVVIALPAVLAL